MKTTSNNKIFKIILSSLLLVLILTALFFGFKLFQSQKFTPLEIAINTTDDQRALGYSGQNKIAADSKGNVYITYRKKYEGKYQIFVTRISNHDQKPSVFGTEKPIAQIKNFNQRVPSIAIDSKDVIHVLWYGSDDPKYENNRQIKYARSEDYGVTWSPWRNISFVSGFSPKEEYWQEHPVIFAGKNDILYAAWEGKDNQNSKQQIKFSSSTNNGLSWSQWQNIKPESQNTQSRPALSQGLDGKLHLLMYSSHKNENGTQQIQHTFTTVDGNNWSDWQTISQPDYDSRHLSVINDKKGSLHIVWRASSNQAGPSQIFYRALVDEKWSEIMQVSQSKNFQFFPTISIDKKNTAFTSWIESDEPSGFPREDPLKGTIYFSVLQKNTFSPAKKLSDSSEILLYPGLLAESKSTNILFFTYEKARENDFSIMFKSINAKQ